MLVRNDVVGHVYLMGLYWLGFVWGYWVLVEKCVLNDDVDEET